MAWYDILNQSNVRGRDAGSIARQRLNARAAMPPVTAPSTPAGGLLGNVAKGLFGLNPVTAPYLIPGYGAQREKNRQDVIDMAKGPLNELRYIGSALSRGQIPYSGTQAGAEQRQNPLLGRIPVPGTDSGWWRGSGESPGDLAAERAYRQEVSNIAQQAAQNPELQRYEDARKAAIAAGPGSAAEQSAEDIGMQIWAQKYGKLAPKVKPGQAGFDVIQNTLAGNAARKGAGFKMPDQLIPTPGGFPTSVPGMTQTAPGGYDRGFNIPTNLAPGATAQIAQLTPQSTAPAAAPTFNLGKAFNQPGVLDEDTLKRFSDILLQSVK